MKHHSCALLHLRWEWNVPSSSSVCNMGNRILDYITWVVNIQIICPDVVQQGKESHPKNCAVTSNIYLSISMLAAFLCRCLVIPTDYITVCFILLLKKKKRFNTFLWHVRSAKITHIIILPWLNLMPPFPDSGLGPSEKWKCVEEVGTVNAVPLHWGHTDLI